MIFYIFHLYQGVSLIHLWAVKVGDIWYEIERSEGQELPYVLSKTRGEVSRSGVCFFGRVSH